MSVFILKIDKVLLVYIFYMKKMKKQELTALKPKQNKNKNLSPPFRYLTKYSDIGTHSI